MGKKKQPVEERIDLTFEVALTEAANVLARAGEIASKKEDVVALLQVANGWMQVSRDLDMGTAPPAPERPIVGFTPPATNTDVPERPDPDVED